MRGTSPCPSPQGCLEEAALTWISCRGKNELNFKENVGGIIAVEKMLGEEKFYGNIFFLVCS